MQSAPNAIAYSGSAPPTSSCTRVGHRGDVGGDVDRVGDDQQADQRHRQPARADPADVRREALPRDPADARRQHLDADHQRQRQEQRPDEREAELRAGLRIGRDAARIVVGRAGDQPRPEPGREPLVLVARMPLASRREARRMRSSGMPSVGTLGSARPRWWRPCLQCASVGRPPKRHRASPVSHRRIDRRAMAPQVGPVTRRVIEPCYRGKARLSGRL